MDKPKRRHRRLQRHRQFLLRDLKLHSDGVAVIGPLDLDPAGPGAAEK